MEFVRTKIEDVILCKPTVYADERGYFAETFRQDKLNEFLGFNVNFVQDNESKSIFGVLRGLHFQLPPFAQTKLVRVIKGEVLDVAVDIRRDSPTYKQHVSVILSEENKNQLFIPRGFAHGFVVLSKTAIFAYKVDSYYSAECDRGLSYSEFGIDWKLPDKEIVLSQKDQNQPNLNENSEVFEYGVNYYA